MSGQAPPQHPRSYLLFYLLALLFLLLLAWLGDGRDHYQLLYALQAELGGSSAYGEATFQRIAATYRAPGPQQCEMCAQAGFGYPLTAIWVALPFIWLPQTWWSVAWELVSVAVIITGLYLTRLSPLWVVWWGMVNSIYSNNYSTILIGMVLIGVWAVRQHHTTLASLLIVLLLATKPQTVGVFGLALAWQLWQRRQWQWLVGFSVLVGGATFAVQPDWIIVWLQSLRRFAGVVPTITHVFWALPLAVVAFRRRWYWTVLALLQMSLPVTTMPYTFLPLIVSGLDHSRARQGFAIMISTIIAVVAPIRLLGILMAGGLLGILFLLPPEQPDVEPSPTPTITPA